jgi:2-methylcitrate dehydratase PrpD
LAAKKSDRVSVAERIAAHVAGCRFEALPASAIAAAKRIMLDTLAVAWPGADAPGVAPVRELVLEQGGRAESTLWAHGAKVPAPSAAFLNSMAAGALDYDSVSFLHADAVMLTAFVVGSDLAVRMGSAITGAHKGWYTTSIYGVFAAAAAASKLLGLDAAAICHSMGIALSQAAGTQQANIEQSLSKRMQPAFAARGGVFSALLAARGITAPRESIEGRFGLYALYQDADPAKVLAGLGERFMNSDAAFKKYPCCACSHAALDATLGLVSEHDLSPDEVKRIVVTHSAFMHRLVGSPFDPGENPQVSAQFSVQYAVACAVLRRGLGIQDISEPAIFDPRIRALTDRIEVVVDESHTGNRIPATISIETRSKGTLVRRADRFPWGIDDAPSDAALQSKALDCFAAASAPLSRERVQALIDRIRHSPTSNLRDLQGKAV